MSKFFGSVVFFFFALVAAGLVGCDPADTNRGIFVVGGSKDASLAVEAKTEDGQSSSKIDVVQKECATNEECDDSTPATNDGCGMDGKCHYQVAEGWCLIDFAGVKAGDVKEGNSCLVCNPDQSKEAWTPVPSCPAVVLDADVFQSETFEVAETPDAGGQPETSEVTVPVDIGVDLGQADGGTDAGNPEDITPDSATADGSTDTGSDSPEVEPSPDIGNDVGTVADAGQDVPVVPKCTAASCDDNNACTNDTCVNGECVFLANTNPCDDGNLCTVGDSCQNKSCFPGKPVVCSALDQCHLVGVCNQTTGECSNPNAPNGTVCVDKSACIVEEKCHAGQCVGSPFVCDPKTDPEFVQWCDPTDWSGYPCYQNKFDVDADGIGSGKDPDIDNDGILNADDPDDDNDGVSDTVDNCPFVKNPSQVDKDGDGFGQGCDFTGG